MTFHGSQAGAEGRPSMHGTGVGGSRAEGRTRLVRLRVALVATGIESLGYRMLNTRFCRAIPIRAGIEVEDKP